MLSEEQLQQIEQRTNKATPGPWGAEYEDENPDDVRVCQIGDVESVRSCIGCLALLGDYDEQREEWDPATIQQWRNDAEFVAHAREDAAAMLTSIRELWPLARLGQMAITWWEANRELGQAHEHGCQGYDNHAEFEAALNAARAAEDALEEATFALMQPEEVKDID
jgi:hypothetical protein